jgi:quinol-cytochrome oxidoreductase complex cytochrome b subunit
MRKHTTHPSETAQSSWNVRTWIDPILLVSFILTAVTGVLMFLHIHFSGMGELHKWAGNLFVLAGIAHLFPNYKLLLKQLKHRFGMVLLILAIVLFGLLTWHWAQGTGLEVHPQPAPIQAIK